MCQVLQWGSNRNKVWPMASANEEMGKSWLLLDSVVDTSERVSTGPEGERDSHKLSLGVNEPLSDKGISKLRSKIGLSR